MATQIKLNNMAAKFLVDYVGHTGWARGHEDVYRAGKLLSEVLPRFGDGTMKPEDPKPASGHEEIIIPQAPVAPTLMPNGDTDWSKMTKQEADDFRAKLKEHNHNFVVWCRTPLAKEIELTDKQLETCQRVLKYYAPRSEEDKQKDREKQIPARPELPINEFTFLLLTELKLASE